MVEKVDIPVEEKQETQEYLDEMSKKADVANEVKIEEAPSTEEEKPILCLLYTSPSPRDGLLSRMPSSA